MAKKSETVKIKKYTNRRLYNTDTSAYVTLDDLAEMVKDDKDFVVVDAKSGTDLTHSVLTQIILDQEGKGQNLMPVNFLRQLIRFYGHGMEKLVPSYLEMSLDTLTRDEDRYLEKFGETFTGRSLEAMQEQTRTNLAMFEKAMSVFSPFRAGEDDGAEQTAANTDTPSPAPRKGRSRASTNELDVLQQQLAAMQKQLNTLSKSK